MATKDPRVDGYIASAAAFAKPILKHLRKVVHAGCPEVEETIKWRMPFFDYNGPICHMAAFKQHCAFGFWKGELVLGRSQNEDGDAMGHFGRITKLSDLPSEKKLIALVRKAAELNAKGIRKERSSRKDGRRPLDIPEYLTNALKKKAKARKAFEGFSYSQKKEYVDWLADAKREETRRRRLATTLQWLEEGKPQNWRYMAVTK